MSSDSAMQWILKLHEDEELRQQAEAAGNFEARQTLAKEHGFEYTKEEIKNAVAACNGKLDEDDLDAVAGGVKGNPAKAARQTMQTAKTLSTVAVAAGAAGAAL